MKQIYSFKLNKKISKEITEDTPDGKLTKNVESLDPVEIILKFPSRSESQEKSVVYAVEYSEGIKKGLLTNAIVERNYDKDGYITELKDKVLKLSNHLIEVQNDYRELTTKEDKDSLDAARLKEIEQDWNVTQVSLQDIKNTATNIFNYTAESFADQKAMLWLTLHLTYIKENGGEPKPLFRSDSQDPKIKFEQKLKHFDVLSELDDNFYNQVIDKVSLYIGLWYSGKVTTKEEFDVIENQLNQETEDAKEKQDSSNLEEAAKEPEVAG